MSATAAVDLNDGKHCPVCEQAFALDDLCATDIEMGACHAACLDGAAVVDLETGDPTDGKVDVYRFASLFSEAEIDDMALAAFTAAMRDKLARKRDEGRGGWHDKTDCTNEHLSDLLRRHVEKGDPVDVANLAMMIHQRGEQIDAYVPGSWEAEERLTVAQAWTILCETPDITSPEEYPDHALITMEQLGSFMERAAPKIVVTDEAQARFNDYFIRNYPGKNTVIFDPSWHAPKIFRAAIAALSEQTASPEKGGAR